MTSVAVDDRHTAVSTERTGGDLDAHGPLAPFELIAVNGAHHTFHYSGLKPHAQHLLVGAVFLNVGLKHPVKQIVRRQIVVVTLVGLSAVFFLLVVPLFFSWLVTNCQFKFLPYILTTQEILTGK